MNATRVARRVKVTGDGRAVAQTALCGCAAQRRLTAGDARGPGPHDLEPPAWFDGALAVAEPKRLHHRVLDAAAAIVCTGGAWCAPAVVAMDEQDRQRVRSPRASPWRADASPSPRPALPCSDAARARFGSRRNDRGPETPLVRRRSRSMIGPVNKSARLWVSNARQDWLKADDRRAEVLNR